MATVLIIDDDKFVRKILDKQLSKHFDVIQAENGEQGIEVCITQRPDVVLLDVEMPGLNGYEVCDQLRHSEVASTPIIILSSHSSLRERMLGYEAGADDYLQKPCEAEEVVTKISKLLDNQQQKIILKQQAVEAQQTAMIALSSNSEIGLAMLFAEQCIQSHTEQELCNKIFAFANKLQLKASVMIIDESSRIYNSDGDQKPLVDQIMPLLHGQQRIVDFGGRTQFNYPNISLLVRNMPLKNREKYGRIKDIIPPILATADARLKLMQAEKAMNNHLSKLQLLVGELHFSMQNMEQSNHKYKLAITSCLQDMSWNINNQLMHLGLEEDQERTLLKELEGAIQRVEQNVSEQGQLEEGINLTTEKLEQLVTQFSMVDLSTNSQSQEAPTTPEDDELNNVELF